MCKLFMDKYDDLIVTYIVQLSMSDYKHQNTEVSNIFKQK